MNKRDKRIVSLLVFVVVVALVVIGYVLIPSPVSDSESQSSQENISFVSELSDLQENTSSDSDFESQENISSDSESSDSQGNIPSESGDELPEGYFVDICGWSWSENGTVYDEHVRIRHNEEESIILQKNESIVLSGKNVTFLGFSGQWFSDDL